MEKLFNGQEISILLGIPYQNILKMAREGDLPSVKVGKRVRFEPQDIANWIIANRRDIKNLKK